MLIVLVVFGAVDSSLKYSFKRQLVCKFAKREMLFFVIA